jgi:putative colanic acid biosynthesis acetyltransferase WcaF
VECYSVDRITLEPHSTVSQFAFLCTATHDYEETGFPLVTRPITVGAGAWVAAGAFVAPGVRISPGAVVLARATVARDVPALAVVGGTPARFIKWRRVEGGLQPARGFSPASGVSAFGQVGDLPHLTL